MNSAPLVAFRGVEIADFFVGVALLGLVGLIANTTLSLIVVRALSASGRREKG